jgi:nodulation protein E
MTRVVVTGMGVVSPCGATLDDYWQALLTGKDIFSVTDAAPGFALRVGAIGESVAFDRLSPSSLAACDRTALFALSAAEKALASAGLLTEGCAAERIAVVTGTAAGGMNSIEAQYERLFRQGVPRAHPLTIVRSMISSTASWVALAFGLKGPAFTVSSACASSAHAIGFAAQLIRGGLADVAVAVGTEAPLSQGTVLAWHALKVMSFVKCRPFSRTRDGLMISEGAAALVLESEAHARARGLRPDVAVAGFACNSDAGDIVAPTRDGMARAMRDALADARIEPGRVDYVNAHGTGTRSNDATETQALKLLFGAERTPPVSSTKGVTGHPLGAAGAFEAVATILAMQRSVAPPTANFDEPDPACGIDVIPDQPRAMEIDVALSNSFAFGGLNAALAFEKI